MQPPCGCASRLQPISSLAQRIFRLVLARLGGSAATRGCLHAAAVNAQLHRIGGIAHLLFGREGDFRGLEGVRHGDFLRGVHLFGGNCEADRAEFGEIHALTLFESVAHDVA